MIRISAVATALCLVIVLLGGCDAAGSGQVSAAGGEGATVVLVPKLTGSPFFDAANDGAQAYAEKHGFQVRYEGDPIADVQKQISIIKEAIARKDDAICISTLDAAALDSVLKEAMAAGIKVVTWDSDAFGDARMVMVSQGTPAQLGEMLVEMGAKSLTSRGLDPTSDAIQYVWHYSQESTTDQNSWRSAGEKYIAATYPNWVNVAPENYYSEQNAGKAISVGMEILTKHPDIDLIICNDSTALPGQAEVARRRGLTASDVTITGFAPPNDMRKYCEAGIVERWGLWDCQVQAALGCYLAQYLAGGNRLKVGGKLDVPEIGFVEVMPNTVLDPNAYTADDSGVVLLPSRTEFTIDNVDEYDF